jgi:hypothetical protein
MEKHPFTEMLSRNQVTKAAATDASEEILRTTASEQSFTRKFLNAQMISDPKTQCDRLPTSNKPVKFDEMEHECEAAFTIPFGGQPINSYMHLPVFVTTFARNVSPRVYDDKDNLLMYRGDIEQLFYTLLLREVLDVEVSAFIGIIDLLCGNLDDDTSTASVASGGVAFASVGAAGRDSLGYAMQSFPSTYGNLSPASMLMNNITIWDVHIETDTANAGDGLAEKTWLEGYQVVDTINGVELVVTMKNRVVNDHLIYLFTDPAHLGRMYILEDAVLVNESHAWWVDMFLYSCLGGSLPNYGAFRKVSMTGAFAGTFKVVDLAALSA